VKTNWLAEEVSASREGLCFTELFIEVPVLWCMSASYFLECVDPCAIPYQINTTKTSLLWCVWYFLRLG